MYAHHDDERAESRPVRRAGPVASVPLLALQRGAGNAATTRLLQVQRAVGFEYELGTVETYRKGVLFGRDQRYRLKGKEVIARHDGFDVTADEPPAGQGGGLTDLEIVVHHLDDADPASRKRLGEVMGRVEGLAGRLQRRAGQEVPAAEVGAGWPSWVYLRPEADDLAGQLQMTGGLSMAALGAVLSGKALRATAARADRLPAGTSKDTAQAAVDALAHYAGPAEAESYRRAAQVVTERTRLHGPGHSALTSVMAMLVAPAQAARQRTLPYPKAATGLLMARTDFATIIGLLPADARTALARRHGLVTDLVLDVLGRLPGDAVDRNDPVFPKEMTEPGYTRPTITFAEWLDPLGAAVPVDRMTTGNYPVGDPASLEKRMEAASLDSLGALGDQTDPARVPGTTGEPGKPRPIYEFRALSSLYPDALVNTALGLWDFVALAHQRKIH